MRPCSGSDFDASAARAPALVLLAGGMGRRFGGDKQVEAVGPAGEPLGAYTAFDARAEGFGEIVLVTRPGAETEVRAVFESALGRDVPVRCVPQRWPPGGLGTGGAGAPERLAPERARPWGTAHAALAAAECVEAPFAVANADDAYGREGLKALREGLRGAADGEAVLVTYPAGSVLSRHGGVSRGWVRRGGRRGNGGDGRGDGGGGILERVEGVEVVQVVEVHGLRRRGGCAMLEATTERGAPVALAPDAPVSMNLWGLTPGVVDALRAGWLDFVSALGAHRAGPEAAEYQLSTALSAAAREGHVRLKPTPGGSGWFGITFADDLPNVRARVRALHAEGVYPERLSDRRPDRSVPGPPAPRGGGLRSPQENSS